MRGISAALILSIGQSVSAQSLELPPRPTAAPKGAEFARSITGLSLAEREQKVLEAVRSGNVPLFLRKLAPVTVESGANTATYFVTPDYLAIGSDDDYFIIPISPSTAQVVADLLGCSLPTTRMVDDVYANATIKLTPAPIPPSPAMTTIPVFLRHNELVMAQRKQKPPGGLIAGHKKDVVIAAEVFAVPGKVAIYGWHKPDGKPIQLLYTGHTATWVDYSHGIRLVQRRMTVNGQIKTIDEVLADPGLAPLLSRDGVMRESRYPVERVNARVQAAAPCPPPARRSTSCGSIPEFASSSIGPWFSPRSRCSWSSTRSRTATRSSRRSARRSGPATIGTSISSTSVPRRGSCGNRSRIVRSWWHTWRTSGRAGPHGGENMAMRTSPGS